MRISTEPKWLSLSCLALLAAPVAGCSGLDQVFSWPSGPNAPVKALSSAQASDGTVFRGVVTGACVPVDARVDAAVDEAWAHHVRVGCLLPVRVGAESEPRRVLCLGAEVEPRCVEWGESPGVFELSFFGKFIAYDGRGVYVPAGKDQIKAGRF